MNGYYNFLNKRIYLGFPPKWNHAGLSKLWLYNLHYFDYIWPLDYSQSKQIVLGWIDKYPLLKNNVGWESYPISLRIMNWCSIFFHKFRLQTESDERFLIKLCESIRLHAQWLIRHMEVHLMGNHLFENAAALVFAGSCFGDEVANGWYEKGKKILKDEIEEQILPDGMHFERSGMYHLRITSLLSNLLNINNSELSDIVEPALKRMLKALKCITHPDGDISLFNDGVFKIYHAPKDIMNFAEELLKSDNLSFENTKTDHFSLSDAGYYGYRDSIGNYIICDAGPIGPDYIPGHSHADIFTFELSLKGHRVIVDSGVYDYEVSQMRQYCRSTKAHNTIEIDEQDQCEMWAAFRVARRGKPGNVEWKTSGNGFRLSSSHNGYKRLKGNPLHHRTFIWDKSGKLFVVDKITSKRNHTIKSRLHLHPDCEIIQIKNNAAIVKYPAGRFKITFFGAGNISIEDSFYCPEFGIRIQNKVLVFSLLGLNIETKFQIEVL